MIRPILLALAVAAAMPLIAPPPAPAAVAAAETRMAHISVEVLGKGPPVILVPGLSSPRAVWDGIAPELAKRHRVYLVQASGFGGDDPGANLEPGVLAGVIADLHRLIEAEKLHGAAYVGPSGHFIMLDQPAAFAQALVAFLKQ